MLTGMHDRYIDQADKLLVFNGKTFITGWKSEAKLLSLTLMGVAVVVVEHEDREVKQEQQELHAVATIVTSHRGAAGWEPRGVD